MIDVVSPEVTGRQQQLKQKTKFLHTHYQKGTRLKKKSSNAINRLPRENGQAMERMEIPNRW